MTAHSVCAHSTTPAITTPTISGWGKPSSGSESGTAAGGQRDCRATARARHPQAQSSSIAARCALAAASASACISGETSLCMRLVSSEIHEISSSIGLSFAGSCCE